MFRTEHLRPLRGTGLRPDAKRAAGNLPSASSSLRTVPVLLCGFVFLYDYRRVPGRISEEDPVIRGAGVMEFLIGIDFGFIRR